MQDQSQALAYLDARILHGVKFGLETVRAVLEALAHPERTAPMLLVAGTNGKGSVAAYADALLRASGLSVGRYTSPHLERLNERIAVDGRDISDSDLEARILAVRDTAEELLRRGVISDHPTYFEALTVAAFDHFRRARVDVGVIEIGMGGRLDATNACEPSASAIVTVALDHERFLGDNLAAIAREKAGVLRPARVTVLGPLPPEARAAIEEEARRVGARLADAWDGSAIETAEEGVGVRTPRHEYTDLRPLPGAHQRDNLLVALRLVEAARDAGLRFDPAAVRGALADVRWPGRLEWLSTTPRILLDGAHNPAAAAVLADYLRGIGPFVLVFGAMADKDIPGIAQALFPLAHQVVLTRAATGRAATPEQIIERCAPLASGALRCEGSAEALNVARELAASDETIVVAGSLYLVGEVRAGLAADRRWANR
jgi:dihydrofolate synthase/folylpolyglutamate synthase